MVRNRANSHVHCRHCPVAPRCIPHHLSEGEKENVNAIITQLHCIQTGEHLYFQHQKGQHIFAVYSGACKEYIVDEEGNEKINGFYFPGDLLALESLSSDKYASSVVALEASQCCAIPLHSFFQMMNATPALMQRFLHLISEKLQKNKTIPLTTNAKCRVAAFLLDVYSRIAHQTEKDAMCLPMSQFDISNFLGLAHETISRTLHAFRHKNIIHMIKKNIYITDINALKSIAQIEVEYGI